MKFIKLSFAFSLLLLIVTCKKDTETTPVTPPPTDSIPPPVVYPDTLREDNLLMGNPSGAVTDISFPDNYLMVKNQFTLSYNNSKGTPNWVSWHLSTGWKGSEPRCDCFASDNTLPASFYHTQDYDYTNTGFDRGHQCPSNDRDKTAADNAVTFLMTNIIPQAPHLNQVTWNGLEDYCQTLMNAGNELYIISGGHGSGGSGSLGGITYTVANGHVTVPADCWKVVVILPVGANDLSRVTSTTRVIAIDIPNTQTVNTQLWGTYRISVDSLEILTGYNFLSAVADSIQNVIEANADNGPTQ
jgi:endonuclease G